MFVIAQPPYLYRKRKHKSVEQDITEEETEITSSELASEENSQDRDNLALLPGVESKSKYRKYRRLKNTRQDDTVIDIENRETDSEPKEEIKGKRTKNKGQTSREATSKHKQSLPKESNSDSDDNIHSKDSEQEKRHHRKGYKTERKSHKVKENRVEENPQSADTELKMGRKKKDKGHHGRIRGYENYGADLEERLNPRIVVDEVSDDGMTDHAGPDLEDPGKPILSKLISYS